MTETRKIRLLVVDDSSFVRRALIRILQGHPQIEVIDVASDGAMALEKVRELHPDVITLDVMMPVMDGLSALERIMAEHPLPVVMLSSVTERGGEKTLRALELGAVDFIDKSAAGGAMDFSAIARELTSKVIVAASVDLRKMRGKMTKGGAPLPAVAVRRDVEAVLIGTSTGGPSALQTVLSQLPGNFPVPVVVVQHMPPGFTESLAQRLNRLCALTVKEAEHGEILLPGSAYIAPAGLHLKLRRSSGKLAACLDPLPPNALHRPSVDVLLLSAAEVCGGKCIACILTGMGRDGAIGAAAIRKGGGAVYVEDETTAIVNGMPKAAAEATTVNGVLPLYAFADSLVKAVL